MPPKSYDLAIASGGPQQIARSVATNLGSEMEGDLPQKLKTITFSGAGFTQLADNVFRVHMRKFSF